MNIYEIKERRQELLAEIEKLDAEEKAFNELTADQQNAVKLHDTVCKRDHINDCEWVHDESWDDYTHKLWLRKAKAIVEVTNIHTFCQAHNAMTRAN